MIALCVALALSQANPISVKDVRGHQLVLAKPPMRIVSLAPALTEICFALGLGPRLVGVTSYCDFPSEAVKLPKIGDVNTSTEKVLAQRPDLVLAGQTSNRRAIADLERLGLRVFVVEPDSLASVRNTIDQIGLATGVASAAQKLSRQLAQQEAEAKRIGAGIRKKWRVLAPAQVDPLMVVGGGTFLDDCISLCSAVNVGSSAGKGYPSFSPERLLASPPDVLLCSKSAIERMRQHPALGRLQAVRSGRFIELGTEGGRPGPRLAGVAVKLAKALAALQEPR